MRRLVASGLLPERAGQPVKMWAHISLAELRASASSCACQLVPQPLTFAPFRRCGCAPVIPEAPGR